MTPSGRLEWVVPRSPAEQGSESELTHSAAQPSLGAEIVSAEDQALIEANHAKIEELRTLPSPSPDLHDLVTEIMAMANPPALSLAVAGWLLQATGLVPMPIFGSAVMAIRAAGFIGHQLEHRLHSADVPSEARDGAAQLWERHPGIALSILTVLMGTVIDSLKNATSVDDTELEDELDAFYPRWSRTDFEFDLRRYRR